MKKRKIESKITLSKETLRILTQEDCRKAHIAGAGNSASLCLATEGCCDWH
jgi:hypothetical protein